jgi:hypothetical protein
MLGLAPTGNGIAHRSISIGSSAALLGMLAPHETGES